MKYKFCWLPTKVYSSKYHQDGFRWLTWVWLGNDGKHYTSKIEKMRARFDSEGRLLWLMLPRQLVNDPVLNQEVESYKIKCNGHNPYGLGAYTLTALRGLTL